MTDWRSSLRADPTPWLLENASAPIRYRVLTELLDQSPDDPEVKKAKLETFEYAPALQLQRKQRKDGTWGGKIHAGDPRSYELCLENVACTLFEYGWNRDTKPVRAAAKVLRTFMTQKKEIKLFEFQKVIKADETRERYYRWFLRILALGLLIRAGYTDERSRTGVLELLDLTSGFVDNPISRNPVDEIGASHPLIRADAWNRGYAFIPDLYTTRVLAASPWLLDGELAKMRLKKIFDYVMSPVYQSMAPSIGLVRTAKGSFVKGHGIRVLTVDEYQKQGHLDELLVVLELLSRLGLLNRYPRLMAHLEWLHSQQSREGRWNLATKLMSDTSRWTALLRVEKDWRSPVRKEADMTFRMLLIFKYQWERQIRMLDRRDDGYPI
jgi:hypothetical protein